MTADLTMQLYLHPKQSMAFTTRATEVLFGGAAGGGKSFLLRVAAIAWCTATPGLQVYLFRRTFPDLTRNHMEGPGTFPDILGPWIENKLCRINASRGQIVFANGSKIHLSHCQHKKDLQSFQGAEIHVLMIDELTQWSREMYSFLRGRLRLGNLRPASAWQGKFPCVLACANPGGVGHAWVKAAFVDSAPAMALHRMPKAEGGMLRCYVPAKLEDNPTLQENDPDYEARLEGLGSAALVKAMRYGDWDIVAGGLFDDVWDRAVHVVEPFSVPPSWRVDRAFDWGSARPFSVGWWAESDGSDLRLPDGARRPTSRGDLFRVAEWYGWTGRPNEGLRLTAREIAAGIRTREQSMPFRVRPGPADSAIFNRENGQSIAEDMAALGVTWERADKSPGSRKQGWQRLRSLLKGASSNEAPGLYVFSGCQAFIRTVPVLPRDEKDPDDIDTNAEDHAADETRYRIYRSAAYLKKVRVAGT